MARTHQPGYLEAKTVKILQHARDYVSLRGHSHFTVDLKKVFVSEDARKAFEIIDAALQDAKQVRRVALQLQRGY